MRVARTFLAITALALGIVTSASATPSSALWSVASTDVQPFRVLHLGVDNYFTVFRDAAHGAGDFPTDLGLTVGVLPGSRLQMEVGVDALEPTDHPLVLNAKLGLPEGVLFPHAPSLSAGGFGFGTQRGQTDANVLHVEVGRSIPRIARFFVGAYTGNARVLRNARGAASRGVMVAFDRELVPSGPDGARYSRLVVCGDYCSGDNALAGGSLGITWFLAPTVSLSTGPVWFERPELNGRWKLTVQLDVNAPF